MKIRYQLLSIFFLFFQGLPIQSQSYHLAVSSEPYHDLVGGIALIDSTWDDPAFIVPLGFNFEFFGETTTNLYSSDPFVGGIFFTNLDINALNLIFAFSADLIDRGYDIGTILSPISFKTEGAPGTRTTTVQFKDAGFFSGVTEGGTYVDFINFQLKIYEGSGDIEMHIGPYSIDSPDLDFDGSPGPIVGLIQGFDLENITVSGEVELLNGNALTPDIITSFTDSYLTWPIPQNTVYRFSKTSTAVHDVTMLEPVPFYYPNPSTGFVTLNPALKDKITSDVNVINAQGMVVKTDNKPERIDLDGLSPGIYVLKFQTDSGIVVQKISLIK